MIIINREFVNFSTDICIKVSCAISRTDVDKQYFYETGNDSFAKEYNILKYIQKVARDI